ncbi:serine/threonine-protein kinase [Idiomarina seosinensis]|uniref:serine/threonine-protein kinase n=1 Tax=Idiomarina seosinensis TaxID=281739 RepID=UPI0013009334|nr:serine/threonine-protein kinase [Idiomarina seosinensis]
MTEEGVDKTADPLRFPYRIASRYHCKGYLGSGGSGLVFKAWDDLLQRMVAIKFIRNPTFVTRQRLVSEARALAKVNHPSLCSIYDIGEPVDEHSSLFMVMELIEGARLSELAGQLNIETTVRLIQKLAEGVAQLHAAGLVHNDINPTNVIIKHNNSDEPIPTLIDLSVADTPSKAYRNRQTGFGLTPLFSAPEQNDPKLKQTHRRELVDIYSLGALMFFLFTGQAPTSNPEQQLNEHAAQCPARLKKLIVKCVANDPAQRIQSASLLAQNLAAYRYQRYSWFPVTALVITITILFTATIAAFSDNNSIATTEPLEQIDVESIWTHQGIAYSLYTKELLRQNRLREARQQANLTVRFFQSALKNNSAEITALSEFIDFLERDDGLFNPSERTALLLDTASRIEKTEVEQHIRAYALAKIYFKLAKLHRSQPHLHSRWRERALSAVSSALEQHPNSQRYQQLRCIIKAENQQSSGGTC